MLSDIVATSGRQYWRAGNIKKAETAQISNSQMLKLEPIPGPAGRSSKRPQRSAPPPAASSAAPRSNLSKSAPRRTDAALGLLSPSQWFLLWSQSAHGFFYYYYYYLRERAGVTGWAPEPRLAAATRSDPSPSSRFLKTPAGRQSATAETHQIIIIIIINSSSRRPQTSLSLSGLSLLIITFPAAEQTKREGKCGRITWF